MFLHVVSPLGSNLVSSLLTLYTLLECSHLLSGLQLQSIHRLFPPYKSPTKPLTPDSNL